MWKDVYANFSDLPKHEQIKLFNLLKEDFFSNDDDDMKGAFTRPNYTYRIIDVCISNFFTLY